LSSKYIQILKNDVVTNVNVVTTKGYSLALGSLSKYLIIKNLNNII